jgi:hypothetical protein
MSAGRASRHVPENSDSITWHVACYDLRLVKSKSSTIDGIFMVVAQGRGPAEALEHAIERAREEARGARLAHPRARAEMRARAKLQGYVLIPDSVEEILRRAEAQGPRPRAESWEHVWLPQLLDRLRRGPPSPRLLAEVLLLIGDERIDKVRGTAGCLDLGAGSYLFFGRTRW